MTRGIFIAGNESPLCRAIEAETVNRVGQYAAALIPNRFSGANIDSGFDSEKRLSIEWNPSSPISARALVLAAENRLEHIDDAILVCAPPGFRGSPSALAFSSVEMMINDHVKGWFFLVKELATVFKNRERGTLALIYPDINISTGKDEPADLLGSAALASFRALTSGLLAAAHNESYFTVGFSTTDTGNESAFASYIFKMIDDPPKRSNGKMFKFGKFSFFK